MALDVGVAGLLLAVGIACIGHRATIRAGLVDIRAPLAERLAHGYIVSVFVGRADAGDDEEISQDEEDSGGLHGYWARTEWCKNRLRVAIGGKKFGLGSVVQRGERTATCNLYVGGAYSVCLSVRDAGNRARARQKR